MKISRDSAYDQVDEDGRLEFVTEQFVSHDRWSVTYIQVWRDQLRNFWGCYRDAPATEAQDYQCQFEIDEDDMIELHPLEAKQHIQYGWKK